MNQAFGGDLAGGNFDFKSYITKPSVIIRLVSILFAIIVFGCIINGGDYFGKCLYNNDSNACNYGIAIGIMSFLACIGFLIIEVLFPQISNVEHRKYIVILDMGLSGFYAFLWFVGFCYLTNRWSNTKVPKGSHQFNDVRAAIAFSFFSIFSWALQCFLGFKHYQDGVGTIFASSDDIIDQQQPYPGSGTLPDPVGRGGSSAFNDDQMIGGDLSGGYQQQHY